MVHLTYRKIGEEFAVQCLKRNDTINDIETCFNQLWNTCCEFDLFKIVVPKKYGGLEYQIQDIVDLMYGIGYGSGVMGIMFAVNVHIWACIMPILKFGVETTIQELIPDLMSGKKIGAHAISENLAGSDVFHLQTVYKEVEDGYVLRGSKNYVTNAPFADLYLVYAKQLHTTTNLSSITCFLINKHESGFTQGKLLNKMGMPLSPMAPIYLTDVFLEQKDLLGKKDQGVSVFQYTMSMERVFLLAFQVGIMEKQLETCIKFCKTRMQFDRAIINFQSVSDRLAEMKVRLEACKLFLENITIKMKTRKNIFVDSSIAKLFISDSLYQNSIDAMKNYGTIGYLDEYNAAQQLKDSLGSYFYSGTSDIQKNIIVSML